MLVNAAITYIAAHSLSACRIKPFQPTCDDAASGQRRLILNGPTPRLASAPPPEQASCNAAPHGKAVKGICPQRPSRRKDQQATRRAGAPVLAQLVAAPTQLVV